MIKEVINFIGDVNNRQIEFFCEIYAMHKLCQLTSLRCCFSYMRKLIVASI